MPADALSALPQLAGLVEKLGVVGLLLIAVVWLVYERMRLMKDKAAVTQQRDRWRLAYVKCKAACDGANPPIRVDLSDLQDLVGEASG